MTSSKMYKNKVEEIKKLTERVVIVKLVRLNLLAKKSHKLAIKKEIK